ncbi:hypothetical protein EV175_005160, partial [Coemansia sp. RSA 1933]
MGTPEKKEHGQFNRERSATTGGLPSAAYETPAEEPMPGQKKQARPLSMRQQPVARATTAHSAGGSSSIASGGDAGAERKRRNRRHVYAG